MPFEAIDEKTAVDFLEPELGPHDLVRDARVQAIAMINRFAAMLEPLIVESGPVVPELAARFWGCCFGFGLNVCDGRSMTEIADSLGTVRAAISKYARDLTMSLNLPPSYYMKKEEASEAYSKKRIEVVKESAKE